MYRRSLSLILSLLPIFLATLPAIAADAPVRQAFKVDGVAREALVYVPASAAKDKSGDAKPAPLVFVFHGHGGNMQQAAKSFHIHELWPEAIVVYPQGLPTPGQLTDPEGKKNGWQPTPGTQEDRDLKFFDEMLKSIHTSAAVDDKRVFSTGHSNGGGFTFQLWATHPDVFAAVAPSGALYKDFLALKPKPVLHVAGSKDPLVKFEWQEKMMSVVKKLNGCDEKGEKAADGTVTYASKAGTPLVTYIYDGGHTFPREAPELIVKFFKAQGK